MIQVEYFNDGTLIKHYSDAGYLLLQNETGAKYAEPIDAVPCQYTYTEINELVDGDEENSDEATIEDYQEALSEFGVSV